MQSISDLPPRPNSVATGEEESSSSDDDGNSKDGEEVIFSLHESKE